MNIKVAAFTVSEKSSNTIRCPPVVGFGVQVDNHQVDIAHHEMFSAKVGKVGEKLAFWIKIRAKTLSGLDPDQV